MLTRTLFRAPPLMRSSIPSLLLRPLSTSVRSAIDKAVGSAPVVLFMKGTPETPQCGFSRTSIQILGMQGLDPRKFTAFNVLEDEELRSGIKEYSDWPTIPQLYVEREFVGGCDILLQMHKDGSLADMLGTKGLVVEEEGEDASATESMQSQGSHTPTEPTKGLDIGGGGGSGNTPDGSGETGGNTGGSQRGDGSGKGQGQGDSEGEVAEKVREETEQSTGARSKDAKGESS